MCNLKPLIITFNLIFIIFVIYDHVQLSDNNLKKCASLASKETNIMLSICIWLIVLCLISVELIDCFQEKFKIFHVDQAVKICLIKHFIMTSIIPFKTITSCGIREKHKWIVEFLNNRLIFIILLLCFISMIIGNMAFLIYNKIYFKRNENTNDRDDRNSDKKFQWKYVINIIWYISNFIFIVISVIAWFFCFSLDWINLFLFNLTLFFQFILFIFDIWWINFNKLCNCSFK
jgi:hypothetical protein